MTTVLAPPDAVSIGNFRQDHRKGIIIVLARKTALRELAQGLLGRVG